MFWKDHNKTLFVHWMIFDGLHANLTPSQQFCLEKWAKNLENYYEKLVGSLFKHI